MLYNILCFFNTRYFLFDSFLSTNNEIAYKCDKICLIITNLTKESYDVLQFSFAILIEKWPFDRRLGTLLFSTVWFSANLFWTWSRDDDDLSVKIYIQFYFNDNDGSSELRCLQDLLFLLLNLSVQNLAMLMRNTEIEFDIKCNCIMP